MNRITNIKFRRKKVSMPYGGGTGTEMLISFTNFADKNHKYSEYDFKNDYPEEYKKLKEKLNCTTCTNGTVNCYEHNTVA